MEWKSYLRESSENLKNFRALQPETGKGFSALHDAAVAPGALGTREKELIALGIGIANRCIDCMGFHIKAAVRAGASREEIAETVSVAIMMGGGPSFMYGAKALEAYDQLT